MLGDSSWRQASECGVADSAVCAQATSTYERGSSIERTRRGCSASWSSYSAQNTTSRQSISERAREALELLEVARRQVDDRAQHARIAAERLDQAHRLEVRLARIVAQQARPHVVGDLGHRGRFYPQPTRGALP